MRRGQVLGGVGGLGQWDRSRDWSANSRWPDNEPSGFLRLRTLTMATRYFPPFQRHWPHHWTRYSPLRYDEHIFREFSNFWGDDPPIVRGLCKWIQFKFANWIFLVLWFLETQSRCKGNVDFESQLSTLPHNGVQSIQVATSTAAAFHV